MEEKKSKRIWLIYGWVFAALTAVVAVLLIASVCDIYFNRTGEYAYSPEIVAEHFNKISIPFFVWLGLIVASAVAFEVIPVKIKGEVKVDALYNLNRLKKRYPPGFGQIEGGEQVEKIEKLRKTLKIALFCVLGGLAALTLIYLLNGEHFPMVNINKEVEKAALVMLFTCGFALALCVGVHLYCSTLIAAEINIIKAISAKQKPAVGMSQKGNYPTKSHKKAVFYIRIGLAVVGVTFVALGVYNGGILSVLQKAVNICTECIGLG